MVAVGTRSVLKEGRSKDVCWDKKTCNPVPSLQTFRIFPKRRLVAPPSVLLSLLYDSTWCHCLCIYWAFVTQLHCFTWVFHLKPPCASEHPSSSACSSRSHFCSLEDLCLCLPVSQTEGDLLTRPPVLSGSLRRTLSRRTFFVVVLFRF